MWKSGINLTFKFKVFMLAAKGQKMKKLFLLLILFCGVAYGAKLWLDKFVRQPLPLTSPLVIELLPGTGVRTLAAKLTEQKLVPHPLMVRVAARVYGFDSKFKAGEYEIEPSSSLLNVFEKISAGKVLMHRLTLPEGLTTKQMLDQIRQNPFLSGEIDITVGEGELLPETYTFAKGMSRHQLILHAQKAMTDKLAQVWQDRDADLPINSPQELLILASIIEKETGIGAERAQVASVFINRLKIGMRLQTDPTVIYALTMGQEELDRPLLRKDLEIDSPYNTYKYAGLPPTPIANPGRKALEAAAHPAVTPYLYFVANGQGGHNFAKSLDEHNQNVQKWKKLVK